MRKYLKMFLSGIFLFITAGIMLSCGEGGVGDVSVNDSRANTVSESGNAEITDAETQNQTGTTHYNGTPFIPDTVYPTSDTVVALYDVTKPPYNADPTGKTDATAAINKALSSAASRGGGTVWLPVGKYRVDGAITVPPYCTLRGDWQDPDAGSEYGTVIYAYCSEDGAANKPLFTLGGSAGVNGLTVYYPNQSLNDVKAYPFTFYTNGIGDSYMLSSVTNCTVINGYQGIGACVVETNPHEMLTVENLKGTFLRTAAEVYNQADVGTWKQVRVSTEYWTECTLDADRPTSGELKAYTRANTVGLILGDLEWTEFAGLYVSDCKYGIRIVKGHRIEFAGSFFNTEITDCDIALKVDSLDERWGMTVANSVLRGSEKSIENNTGGVIKTVNVKAPDGCTGNVNADMTILDDFATDSALPYKKPKDILYVFNGSAAGKTNVTAGLQALLDKAGKTGGIVYLPGGFYRLDEALKVPSGVELRGSAGSPTREQGGQTNGTVLLAYYGDGGDAYSEALITLEENAGVNGVRILFPENGPLDSDISTCYAIRGVGSGVYCVNCSIAGAAYGLDFSGCSGHFIKKLITACYYNAIRAGGDGGRIEGCLQNGTVLVRCGAKLSSFGKNMITEGDLFGDYFPITQKSCSYIIITGGSGEFIYNTFAYGIGIFLTNRGAENTVAVNVGCDNIGNCQFKVDGGSVTAIGALRYAGKSYKITDGKLKLYARLAINDKNEDSLEPDN